MLEANIVIRHWKLIAVISPADKILTVPINNLKVFDK